MPDRRRRNFCGTLSQKFLWIVVPEISACESLSKKFLWLVETNANRKETYNF